MDTGSKKLSVLGDSISKHYGPYLKRALRGVFDYDRKRNPGDRVEDLDKPVGANGGDSVQVLEYLERQADRAATYCDVVLINCGLHDIRRRGGEDRLQVQPESYRSNLRGIFRLASRLAQEVIWIRTTPVDDGRHNRLMKDFKRYGRDVDQYNAIADRIASECRIPAIDLHGFTVNLGSDVYCDHVHFRDEVKAQQAAFIAGFLLCRIQATP